MDTAIFATNPGSRHKFGRDAHKPGIRVVVGSAGLAAKFGVAVELSNVAPETHRCSTALAKSTQKHLLHEISTLIRNNLTLFGGTGIDFVAVAV